MVTRATPPSDAYPLAAPFDLKPPVQQSLLARCFAYLSSLLSPLLNSFRRKFDRWRPLQFGRWLHHDLGYRTSTLFIMEWNTSSQNSIAGLYKSLRILSSGYDKPLRIKRPPIPSPYQIFYNLYKPSTPFKKTAPPAPDFSVVVIK